MTAIEQRPERPETAVTPGPTAPNEVASLLQQAIQHGVGVDGIEKLVGLMERLEDRAAAKAFHDALGAFQSACPPIPKTSTAKIVTKGGASFSYTYAELDTIAEHVRPFLTDHGFSYGWDSTVTEQVLTAVCTLRHRDGHTESATFSCPVDGQARMSAAQQHAAALTYARRQSLVQVLGLTTTDPDPDAPEEVERIDENQVVELEELFELLTVTLSPADRDKLRTRFFMAIAVPPRDDGDYAFADVPAASFERAKNFIQKRLDRQESA